MENNECYSRFIDNIQQRRNNDAYDYCRNSRAMLMHEFFAVNQLNVNDVIQCSILSEKLNQLSIDIREKINNYIEPTVLSANSKNYHRVKDSKNHWKSKSCNELVLNDFLKKYKYISNDDSETINFKKHSIFDPKEVKSPDLKKSKLSTNSEFKEFNDKKNIECPPIFHSAKSELLKQHDNYKSILCNKQQDINSTRKALGTRGPVMKPSNSDSDKNELIQEEGPLKNIERRMVDLIQSEIMDHKKLTITWNDIIGLEFAKTTIQEIIIWPILRPDIFCGLRRPPRGLLLFGPPGTGKTMIGKCIASESHSTFFSISASTLTSKWIGEGEKMVRALFAVAKHHQPSVIFIDEIDSLLCQRSDNEHESTRRIKTEFLVQIDGVTNISDENDRILLIGATNRPHELDEAARRRFVKRLYIPLPSLQARKDIIKRLLDTEKHGMSEDDMSEIASKTDGLSAADMRSLCNEASLCPIRDISQCSIKDITVSQVRPISLNDFIKAIEHVRPSVSDRDLKYFMEWNEKFGSFSMNYLVA